MSQSSGCLLRIREALPSLSPRERQLASFILAQPRKAVDMQIEQIASACGVSLSTVVRTCKKLGYPGYKALSRDLYSDLSHARDDSAFEDIRPGDAPQDVLRAIGQSSIQAIQNTMAIADLGELERAVGLLCAAQRIDFYGMGSSGLTALDAGNKFTRINKIAIAHADAHHQVLTALTLKPGDVAVLISHSGETYDILRIAQEIKKTGAAIITLTRYASNTLSAMADIRLYSSSTETLLRSGAMSSRIAQLCMIDVLYASVCSRIFDQVRPYLEKSRTAAAQLHLPLES